MNTMQVGLQGLEFYAYHGVYAAEKSLGNRYRVDIEVTLPALEPRATLDDTLDYSRLNDTVKQCMETPTPLLETLCWQVAQAVLAEHAAVQKVWVRIAKHNPPLGNLCEQSYNVLTLHR